MNLNFGNMGFPRTPNGSAGWFNGSAYDNQTAVADFNNWRFALPAWGAEQVTNGTFDTDTDWTKGTGWTIGSGVATKAAGVASSLTQSKTFTVGSLMAVTLTVTRSAGSLNVLFTGGTTVFVGSGISASGTYTVYGTPTSGNDTLTLSADSSFAGTVDVVSMREVILTRGGAALGVNKFPDPGFTGVTGWSNAYQSTVTAVGGRMRVTATGGTNPYAQYQFTDLEIGAKYRFMWNGFAGTAAIPELILGNTGTLANQEYGAGSAVISGFQQMEFTATSVNLYAKFRNGNSGGIGNYFEIDDVSLQKLPATGAFPKRVATFDEFFAFTASSTTERTYVAQSGLYANDLAANAPRRDWRNGKQQFRLEDARTNSIRNNSMVGAVAPSTAPTNWIMDGVTNGVTLTVAGTGTENGFPYIDFRWTGTAVAAAACPGIYFEQALGIAAAAAQVWSNSIFVRVVGGDFTTVDSVYHRLIERTGAGAYVAETAGNIKPTLTSSMLRFSTGPRTLGGTAGAVQPGLYINATGAGPVDVTLRLYAPQTEQGAFASDPILTTSASVQRQIETARFSPLVEAIMQRAAGSITVRAYSGPMEQGPQHIIGNADTIALIRGNGGSPSNGFVTQSASGSIGVNNGAGSTPIKDAPWGVAQAFDSGGRSLAAGNQLGNDALAEASRTNLYLAKSAGGNFMFGSYDFVGISPERLTNAQLQALAVAA